jgi:hypothetical protein
VASGAGDDRLFVWHRDTAELDPAFDAALRAGDMTFQESVSGVSFSEDGTLLAAGSLDGLIKVFRVDSGALLHVLEGSPCELNVRWRTFFAERASSDGGLTFPPCSG